MADPVNFTRPAAERIARVVRAVEYGNRDSTGPSLDRPWHGEPGLRLKLGTFTGNWQTAQYTTVTLHGSTQTASVYNWCNPAIGGSTSNTTESRYVIFGKVNGTHSAVELQTWNPIRGGSFSGTWPKGTNKSVVLYEPQGHVVSVRNLIADLVNGCGSRFCLVTRAAMPAIGGGTQTDWTLVSAEVA